MSATAAEARSDPYSTGRPGPIWRDVRPADVATLVNAAIGLAAIATAWAGDMLLAFHLVFLAIIVDGVDGGIARLGGGGGPLGHIIDTLADVVTFVAAPAAILLMATGIHGWTIAAATVFLSAGLLRLARFQTLPSADLHFYGLSTPGAALLLGTVVMLSDASWAVVLAAGAGAVLMLVRWPVPKLRGTIGIAAAVAIFANLGIYLWTRGPTQEPLHPWHEAALAVQGSFLAIYFIAGPAYLKARHPVGAG